MQISISITAQAQTAQDARDEAASVASQIYSLLEQVCVLQRTELCSGWRLCIPEVLYLVYLGTRLMCCADRCCQP